MRAARRFGNNAVDQAEFQQVGSSKPQCRGRQFRLTRVAPNDGRAAFGADHAIHGILQHEDTIGDAERKRSAAASFADNHGNNGYRQARHFAKVDRDGFGLAPLFGIKARVGAGRVQQADNGALELAGQMHHAHGFAIAFGLGHAEVAVHFLLGVAAFFLADAHHGFAIEKPHAANDGRVVAKMPVAMDFAEIGE